MTDNWANRKNNMICDTCIFYVRKEGFVNPPGGRCRRHAPTLSGWPVIFKTDWCGDHKLAGNETEPLTGGPAAVCICGRRKDQHNFQYEICHGFELQRE